MKNCYLKIAYLTFIFIFFCSNTYGVDSLEFRINTKIYRDLSDTYDGGYLFSSDFSISKNWYGGQLSFGFFQSHSVFQYVVNVEEINRKLIIPFDEISIMKTGSASLFLIPLKNKVLSTKISFGLALGMAKSSQFYDVEYSYSFVNEKFNYLYKNYKLIQSTHFGYEVGLDLSFFLTKKAGLQISSRIQDLSNGGTFFFVGGGLCFRL